jgi:ribosomal protein S18 acetylase RimI-like enzyme
LLINLKSRLEEEGIKSLISYAVFPDPEILEKTIDQYRSNEDLELYGYEVEGTLLGIVGFVLDVEKHLVIRHISVHPEYRGMGYGRGQVLELIQLKSSHLISAETDEDSVDFYRNVGFTITSLGEKYPGIERFQCEYIVEMAE